MKDRIIEIIRKEHLTDSQFADKTKIKRASLSHILTGRNNPSLEAIMKIHEAFDYISLEWLLYGKGEMTTKDLSKLPGKSRDLFENIPVDDSEPAAPPSKKIQDEEVVQAIAASPIQQPTVVQEIKYIDKPQKKITEIRIFFDDSTFEVFRQEK